MSLENAELRKIRTDLIPNEWTLEYFKGLCDIKMPEGAMVSGEQLLELLTDTKRLAFLLERNEAEFRFRGTRYDITRESIDKAMKGQL